MTDSPDIAHIIQLAVAPVFLLAGIGALLSVITNRLGRAVDRARFLEGALTPELETAAEERMRGELRTLDKRMALSQRAISFACAAALLVCVVVAVLFVGGLGAFNVSAAVAVLFVVAMGSLIIGLALFLAEIRLATRQLRVRAELLMK